MSKNFSDYIKSQKKDSYDTVSKNASVKKEELEKLIEMYSGLSEDKLISEFIKMTIERKKQGNLDTQEMVRIRSTIEPFLNEQQKQNLNKVFELIDNVK